MLPNTTSTPMPLSTSPSPIISDLKLPMQLVAGSLVCFYSSRHKVYDEPWNVWQWSTILISFPIRSIDRLIGAAKSAVDGVVMGYKMNFCTSELRTTCSSAMLESKSIEASYRRLICFNKLNMENRLLFLYL